MLSYFLGFCPALCVSFILRLEASHVGYRCDIRTQKHPEEEERLYLYSAISQFSWKSLMTFPHISLARTGSYAHFRDFPVAQMVKHLPTTWETRVRSLGQEDPLEKEMATHSSTLAWRIPWTEERGRLQSMGSKESDTTEWLHFHFPIPKSHQGGWDYYDWLRQMRIFWSWGKSHLFSSYLGETGFSGKKKESRKWILSCN